MQTEKPATKNSLASEIFAALRREILSGKFSVNAKFPSEQMLMRRFDAARTTVRIALSRLKDDGILETRNGSGTYLSAIARRMSGRLGLIIPHVVGGELSSPICGEITRAAKDAGYTVLFGDAAYANDEDRARRYLTLAWDYVAQNVAGVFIEPIELVKDAASATKRVISFLNDHNIPVILLDRDIVPPPNRSAYDVVSIDNVQIGYRLASHLIERGARCICLFARPDSAPTVRLRFQGAREALLDHGHKLTSNTICLAQPDDTKAVARLFKQKIPPDAFLCANDITAIALLKTLSQLNKNVPQDILVTGVDDVFLADQAVPPLSTVRQPCQEIARAAVAAMLQRLRNPALPPRQILLDAPLIERASTQRH